jgi:hypothetical protein
VFTYVPYFMHNPFWGPQATPPAHEVQPAACDVACLTTHAGSVMSNYVGNNWRGVNWASKVGYAENSVGIRIGEGIWAGVSAIDPKPLIVADSTTGKAVWIGRIEEHGQPAWGVITVKANGTGVTGVDALIRRKEYGPPYADPDPATNPAPVYAVLAESERTSAISMRAGAETIHAAMNADAPAPAVLADNCTWFVNGVNVGNCTPPFSGPSLQSIEQVRDRKALAVDESRGLIVYRTFEDIPAMGGTYPRTLQVIDLFRFESGRITEIQAFTSELPYGMKPFD